MARTADETAAALAATGVLDDAAEPALDDIARIAGLACRADGALIGFAAGGRHWAKAAWRMDEGARDALLAACEQAVADGPLMVWAGPGRHPAFLAAARVDLDGTPVGAVCVAAAEARADGLTPEQAETLQALARQVAAQLDLRRTAAALRAEEQKFRVIADTMPQMVWSTTPDGLHDYYNARWYEFTGAPAGSTDGEGWNAMFHPEDQDRAWEAWRRCLATGEPYEIEYRLRRHDGVYRWTLGRALPLRDAQGRIRRWFGTCTDIDDAKRLLEERELVSQELSHRIKNIFSVISGLISISARRAPHAKAYADALRERVMALGRAHDFVRPHSERSRRDPGPATVFAMLGELFAPYGAEGAPRIVLRGEDARIDDRAATPLALIFHELATNAAKYGALTQPEGRVELVGHLKDEAYELVWREVGGPPVLHPPSTEGFGATLSRVSAEGQLGGEMRRDWRPEGLVAELRVPTASLTRQSRVSRSE
ncbi:MAG: sensor histidine kinase [Phenylobacterium sp.]|uniref:sensor histidine kinase n=1 Tax=Phenylobacterium sp. TaxID=1871053 RepID=UPI00391D08F7